MFIVYALYSSNYDKLYIGFTTNVEQRLISHNRLARKGYTVKYRPWVLIYSEEFDDKKSAMKREKELIFMVSSNFNTFIRSLVGISNFHTNIGTPAQEICGDSNGDFRRGQRYYSRFCKEFIKDPGPGGRNIIRREDRV